MALRQRTVTGTLVDGDGVPITGATISFKPTKALGYTSTHVVADREFNVVTNGSDGTFSKDFWCDEDSLVAIDYLVTFPIANNGTPDPLHFVTISLSYQDGSPKDIGSLIAESTPPPSEVPESTWADLIDARIGLTVLNQLSDVVIASPTNGQVLTFNNSTGKWENQAAGGSVAIGGTVSGATAGSVLFAGAAGVLAQDNANFFWDDTANILRLHSLRHPTNNDTFSLYTSWTDANNFARLAVLRSAGRVDLRPQVYSGGSLSSYDDLYVWGGNIILSNGGSNTVYYDSNSRFNINSFGALDAQLGVTVGSSTRPGQIIKLAASQSANAFEVQNSGGTVLTRIEPDGELNIPDATHYKVGGTGVISWNSGTNIIDVNPGAGSFSVRLNASAGGGVVTVAGGKFTPAAGTTTYPPIELSSGTLLTTPSAGAVEYDGKVPYFDFAASQRGVVNTEQFVTNTSDTTLNNNNSAQSIFAAANDTLTVLANTTYFFEALYLITNGTTTHTTGVSFGGTATFTGVGYWAELWSVTDGTISTTAPSVLRVAVATNTVLNATSTAAATTIRLRGIIRTNAAGTLIPQITFSAAPGGTNLGKTNSFFRLYPVGADTVAAVGAWA